MATETLVDSDIKNGEKVVQILDSTDFEVTSAFWFYVPESSRWLLCIASPIVEMAGPKEAYKRLQELLASVQSRPSLSLKDISLLSPRHNLIRLLKVAITTSPSPALSGIRFTSNTINGIFIRDAYIYRLT